jgi:hypothetical protein
VRWRLSFLVRIEARKAALALGADRDPYLRLDAGGAEVENTALSLGRGWPATALSPAGAGRVRGYFPMQVVQPKLPWKRLPEEGRRAGADPTERGLRQPAVRRDFSARVRKGENLRRG